MTSELHDFSFYVDIGMFGDGDTFSMATARK